MNVYGITFAGTNNLYNEEDRHFIDSGRHRNYTAEAYRLSESAKKVGINNFIVYDLDWLKSVREYGDNPKTFANAPFFWAFKPLSIWYTLEKMDFGDFVIYSDSNFLYRSYPTRIIEASMKAHIYAYDHSPRFYPNIEWTYRDIFVKLGCDEEKYWSRNQYHADAIGIYKDDFSIKFIEEWKEYCCNYNIIGENKLVNAPTFKESRDDQSIFSLLAIKYDIQPLMNPCDVVCEAEPIWL